jgi:hypothetical protein
METRRTAAETTGTGTPDAHYNLISVIYHALQGAETYDQYAADAERSGDRELARFLRDVQAENRRRAERAKELLYERLGEKDGRNRHDEHRTAPVAPRRDEHRDPDEVAERERRRTAGTASAPATDGGAFYPVPQMAAGGEVRVPEPPAPVVTPARERVAPVADVRQPSSQAGPAPAAQPQRAPLERGFVAGQDARNANRSFEEIEPELRRDYEAERAGGDAWEELREQVRAGFTQARQSQGR